MSDDAARRSELRSNLTTVEQRIAAACDAAGRRRDEVRLIVVTKTFPATDVRILHDLGVTQVGENRDQEAAVKAAELQGLSAVEWHMIGQLQTNKAKSVAQWASTVHSVNSTRLVRALGKAAASRDASALGCLVQVNLDPQTDAPAGRGGADPAEVRDLADLIASTDGLELRGVMAVAPRGGDPGPAFQCLQSISLALRQDHPAATWISAGMSGDLEAAIGFGATHLRVGGAVLGNRPPLA